MDVAAAAGEQAGEIFPRTQRRQHHRARSRRRSRWPPSATQSMRPSSSGCATSMPAVVCRRKRLSLLTRVFRTKRAQNAHQPEAWVAAGCQACAFLSTPPSPPPSCRLRRLRRQRRQRCPCPSRRRLSRHRRRRMSRRRARWHLQWHRGMTKMVTTASCRSCRGSSRQGPRCKTTHPAQLSSSWTVLHRASVRRAASRMRPNARGGERSQRPTPWLGAVRARVAVGRLL